MKIQESILVYYVAIGKKAIFKVSVFLRCRHGETCFWFLTKIRLAIFPYCWQLRKREIKSHKLSIFLSKMELKLYELNILACW